MKPTRKPGLLVPSDPSKLYHLGYLHGPLDQARRSLREANREGRFQGEGDVTMAINRQSVFDRLLEDFEEKQPAKPQEPDPSALLEQSPAEEEALGIPAPPASASPAPIGWPPRADAAYRLHAVQQEWRFMMEEPAFRSVDEKAQRVEAMERAGWRFED